jgi:hypothetical protein
MFDLLLMLMFICCCVPQCLIYGSAAYCLLFDLEMDDTNAVGMTLLCQVLYTVGVIGLTIKVLG